MVHLAVILIWRFGDFTFHHQNLMYADTTYNHVYYEYCPVRQVKISVNVHYIPIHQTCCSPNIPYMR